MERCYYPHYNDKVTNHKAEITYLAQGHKPGEKVLADLVLNLGLQSLQRSEKYMLAV